MSLQSLEFKTEINQILDLVVNSLYSHKEVFLRELVSNASDAIDKARYESLTKPELLEGGEAWKIKIVANKEANTLTISDNGIGMDMQTAINELGTIAHSGTKEFVAAIKNRELKDNPELIGQFGVGFYSAFMVADKVMLISRPAGSTDKKGVKWESSAKGTYTVEDVEKETKGTDVILHIKDDEKKFLDEWEIRKIIEKYSDYIEHPIVMEVEREKESQIDKSQKVKVKEEETLNSQKAIWLRDKAEITDEDYNQFYKHISHDFTDPAKIIHYKAEGTSEFTALLYLPSKLPFDIFFKEYKIGPALYVKRVQIMDHCEELIPVYLRFIKGVIDSSDLPLNVSREMLQNNRQVDVIKKSVTKKILDTLLEMKKNDYEKYVIFHKEFGKVLKEGIHFDFSKRENIGELILFASTMVEKDKYRTLDDYIKDMRDGQEHIYYLTATSYDEGIKSPHLETFKKNGYEVLILTDEIDDVIFGAYQYKEKMFKSVIRGDISLDKTEEKEKQKSVEKYKGLLEFIKLQLIDDVKDVRLSGRLTDSPCCLVAEEGQIDPAMERMLKAMGQAVPETKRILEVNPNHPLTETLNIMYEKDKKSKKFENYVAMLYEQALLIEGVKPKDPSAFAKAIADLMVNSSF
ncbi:MAG: molecular chaperone HtpG [Candidatus Magnetoovum sp. WYHC-5]|nr:molecular chaperone HtpG [Candidatus Magnetoovum sp. WYHC-5]